MSENEKTNNITPENQGGQISINAQYVKDLSFENPKAPMSLINNKERPNIDVSIDVKAMAIGEDTYEVALTINANAKSGDDKVFITELTYAGVFTLKDVSDAEKEPALLIFCPNLLFPFARRIIADVTRDGGFPPLMLDPIDFASLYAQRAAKAVKDKKELAN